MTKWKSKAIRNMNRTRISTLQFLKPLQLKLIRKPKTQGKWSIQDVMVHIFAWEQHGYRRLQLIQKGKADQLNLYDGVAAENRYNARAVSRYRKVAWKTVLKDAETIRTRFIQALMELPEKEIHNVKHQTPVSVWVPDYAWTHEKEHFERIKKWVKSSKH
jgi:uncharacterized damage-inducible protein DinB